MAGMGIGASSKCCAFNCTCLTSTWPSTLFLTDPVGTITLTRNAFSVYVFNGTRSITAYEYCWSPSPSTVDITFRYALNCVGGSLGVSVATTRCCENDGYTPPFTAGWTDGVSNPCINNGVNACFGAPSPLVTSPGAIVKNRTSYSRRPPTSGPCITKMSDATTVPTSDEGFPCCYTSFNDTGGLITAGYDASGLVIRPDLGSNTVTPTGCSATVNLSFIMSLPLNYSGATVTVTS